KYKAYKFGKIPNEIGTLVNLEVLDFSDSNRLDGAIPQSICNLKQLKNYIKLIMIIILIKITNVTVDDLKIEEIKDGNDRENLSFSKSSDNSINDKTPSPKRINQQNMNITPIKPTSILNSQEVQKVVRKNLFHLMQYLTLKLFQDCLQQEKYQN
ncbi:hypothetical protein BCR32DRAFT_252084, partial [Anaeromyces robustus]